jgi:(p)ppGpp synthase/HD superfamily hydrolase
MSSVPVDRRHHVLAFVALKHVMQVRKYTGEPYLRHLQNVAKMADGKCKFGYEIGLCHDLLEDTDCTFSELLTSLMRWGYEQVDAIFICNRVQDLTDVFIPENNPELNRGARKYLESMRLHSIDPVAQTVKYCDLIDNTVSIVERDKGFAKKYIPEKEAILTGMDLGNKIMYRKALQSLEKAKQQLGI